MRSKHTPAPIVHDCPECELLVEPDMECKECYGTGVGAVCCVRCCARIADHYQDGDPVCAGCAVPSQHHGNCPSAAAVRARRELFGEVR